MKSFPRVKKFLSIMLPLFFMLGGGQSVSAQAGRQIMLSEPDAQNYPRMLVYFDAIERDGNKISDLAQDQLTLREDGIEQDLITFQSLTPGIQLVTAVNISAPFAIQDINGKSRFDYIKEGLLNWANQPLNSAPDDLSLLSNDGLELTHLEDRAPFITALEGYSPDLKETEANLSVLARAITLASDPVSQLGMKRVVLFISSQPSTDSSDALANLLSQAQDNQVQVFTLLVSSPAFFSSTGATRLQNLSTETGGVFTTFSGEEPLVDFRQLFEALRSTYYLEYDSQIVTSGSHQLELSVASSLGEGVGTREFFLDIQPPNPILISPPREVIRSLPEGLDQSEIGSDYQPDSILLDVLIEFPDQHPRMLEELIFRVDGEILVRLTTPPFDQITWDISGYQTSSRHWISLEAVDIQGLSRISVQTPVDIQVLIPPPDIGTIFIDNAPALGGLFLIILTGLVLFLMISRGRIQPTERRKGTPLIHRIKALNGRGLVNKIMPSRSDPGSVLGADPNQKFTPYRLIPINDISQNLFPEPLRIKDPEIKLGQDPRLNAIAIKHHSVAGEHARINLNRGSKHQIADLGTSVGTWVNHQQITSAKPHLLKDGDIINIGEAGFRFQLILTNAPEPATQEKN